MARHHGTKKQGSVRRATETALDVAIGGSALAAGEAVRTLERVVERAAQTLGSARRETKAKASRARRVARASLQDSDARPYEERSREELYALASEREIGGRSSMRKVELIAALRAAR